MSPEEVKELVNHFYFDKLLSSGWKGAIIGAIEKEAGGAENRRKVLGYLFGDGSPLSSRELTESQWVGLREWVAMRNIDDDWLPRKEFGDEVRAILGGKKPYIFDD